MKEKTPGPESPYLKPPQKWMDRIREKIPGEVIGKDCYLTNSYTVRPPHSRADQEIKFSYLTIPKGPQQFRLERGIYVITTVPVEHLLDKTYVRGLITLIGNHLLKTLDNPDDTTPSTTIKPPDDLLRRIGAPEAMLDVGNALALNLHNETMNGGVIWEVVQMTPTAMHESLRQSLNPKSGSDSSSINRTN